jgi:hypothetical protein
VMCITNLALGRLADGLANQIKHFQNVEGWTGYLGHPFGNLHPSVQAPRECGALFFVVVDWSHRPYISHRLSGVLACAVRA